VVAVNCDCYLCEGLDEQLLWVASVDRAVRHRHKVLERTESPYVRPTGVESSDPAFGSAGRRRPSSGVEEPAPSPKEGSESDRAARHELNAAARKTDADLRAADASREVSS
jgi:hypothetical protein